MHFRKRNLTLLVLFIISCTRKSPKYPSIIHDPVTIKSTSERLFDSLQRFSHLSTFSLTDTNGWYSLEKFSLNQKEIAFICKDSSIQIFQKEKDQWKKTEDITDPDFHYSTYETDDYNGDSYFDLNLISYVGSAGNKQATLFLSDPYGKLRYMRNCHLPNMRFNSDTKLVESFWVGGVYSTVVKELHRWQGDSLLFIRSVEFEPSSVPGRSSVTRFYDSLQGKMRMIKEIIDKNESIYDTALFKIKYF